MGDSTIPCDGEVTSYLKVEKVDGTTRYMKVVEDESLTITEQEYMEAHS